MTVNTFMLEQYKEIWCLMTLVDITKTSDIKGAGKTRNQQRNFETLQQAVGILSQTWSLGPPKSWKLDQIHRQLKDVSVTFGKQHDFTQEMGMDLTVWSWRFGIEHNDVFGYRGEVLLDQLNKIPIITGLNENAEITVPVFDTDYDSDGRNVLLICETLL